MDVYNLHYTFYRFSRDIIIIWEQNYVIKMKKKQKKHFKHQTEISFTHPKMLYLHNIKMNVNKC